MIIFGSPSRYMQGPGALSQIGAELARIAADALLILDPQIQDRYGSVMMQSCRKAGVQTVSVRFSGECTYEEIDRLAQIAVKPSIIAAAGGGKFSHVQSALLISVMPCSGLRVALDKRPF